MNIEILELVKYLQHKADELDTDVKDTDKENSHSWHIQKAMLDAEELGFQNCISAILQYETLKGAE